MQLRNGDLRFEVHLDVDRYTINEIAQIPVTTLRVVTSFRLPFRTEALLRAQQFADGFYMLDREDELAVRFAPGLPAPALEVFARNVRHGVPVVLSEESLTTNTMRSWLVMPMDPGYQLVDTAGQDAGQVAGPGAGQATSEAAFD